MSIRRRVVVVLTTLMLIMSATTGVAGAQATDDGGGGDALSFGPCPVDPDAPPDITIECATMTVPADYDEPDGATIDLLVRRIPAAAGPEASVGSLVVNPGGPGGSADGVLYGAFFSGLFPQYDLIGPDPRGVGASSPLVCEAATDAEIEVPDNPFDATVVLVTALLEACEETDGEVLDHLGTVNVAKDFDMIRAALGAEELNYLGYSYGTHLGAVYATYFPERVGRFILDGPVLLDDIGTATLEQLRGFEDSLDRFDAACANEPSCALWPFGGERVWRHLSWRLANEPMTATIDTDDGPMEVDVDDNTLVSATLLAFYSGRGPWADFAQALLDATWGDATGLAQLAYFWESGSASIAAGQAVVCADDTDRSIDARRAQHLAYQEILAGNSNWALRVGPALPSCLPWLVSDENAEGIDIAAGSTAPILIIANTHDPATPYSGALRFAEAVPTGTLLTVVEDGHTIVGAGNSCVDQTVAEYMASGDTPPPGSVCEPDGQIGVFAGPDESGAIVIDGVQPGSGAEGVLFPGDVLVSVDGVSIQDGPPPRIPGATLQIVVLRDGVEVTVEVVVGEPAYWLPD